MKRRIISSILVVVMLVLSLVSCGYSYTKDDLNQYMTFDKAAFEDGLKNLEFEDGEFTTDKETREKKIAHYIYNDLLLTRVDKDAKLTEGEMSVLDQLTYNYYVTYKNAKGEDVYLYASKMAKASTTTISLGDNELSGDDKIAIRDQIVELIKGGKLKDIASYIYTPDSTAKEVKEGEVVYVTYTKAWTVKDKDGKDDPHTETHTNEKLTLTKDASYIVNLLLDKKAKVGTEVKAEADKPFTETVGGITYTYTNVKVNWVVSTVGDTKKVNEEILVERELKTELTPAKGDLVIYDEKVKDTYKIPAKTTLTYHINPVYYLEVEELSSDLILKELLAKLPVKEVEKDDGTVETEDRELACLKDAEEELKTLAEKVKAFNEAETKYEDAKEDYDDKVAARDAINKEKDEAGWTAADEKVTAAKGTMDDAKKKLDETATPELNTALANVYKKVNADEAKAKEAVVADFNTAVREYLTEEYNEEVKNNIVLAVWKLMIATAKVTDHPRKAVQETYDRMYEIYQADFYAGDFTSTQTNYNKYGDFETFLIAKMKTDSNWTDKATVIGNDFTMAKHALWALAEEHVAEIMTIYFVSGLYEDVTYDKSEIKDFKKDDDKFFEVYEETYGASNVLAAHQFDALMNHLIAVEKDADGKTVYDDNGAPKYIMIERKSSK